MKKTTGFFLALLLLAWAVRAAPQRTPPEIRPEISAETARDGESLGKAVSELRQKRNPARVVPSTWPVSGRLTSGFGPRPSPFNRRKISFHAGLDIGAPMGTPVHAPAPGIVIFSGKDGGYGLCVDVVHWGGIVTRHAHLSRLIAKEGDRVGRSSVLGLVGSTGMSTGPHLHYEVIVEGVQVNPMRYILEPDMSQGTARRR